MKSESVEMLLSKLGETMQRIRLNQNLSQHVVAERSGLSLKAVCNLESGSGASLKSFLAICRTLDQLRWMDSLTPPEGPSPMQLLEFSGRPRRQRASAVRKER